MLHGILFLSLLSCFSLNAAHISLGAKISTIGIGIEAGRKLTPYLSLRSSFNFFQYNHNFSSSYTFKNNFRLLARNTIKFKIPTQFRFFNIGIVGDFHPYQNPFALSFGLFYNKNGANCSLYTANDPVLLNNIPNPRANFGTVKAEASFNKISPYLGLRYNSGFGNENKWGFTADLGCLYQGNLKISKTMPNNTLVFGQTLFDPIADNLIKKAYKNKFVKWLKFYPVIGFGIHYKFS